MCHHPEKRKLPLIAVYGPAAANAEQRSDLRRLDGDFEERARAWPS